jgi:IS5 family transposase
MRPKREPDQPQRELFYVELEQIIDRDHPLVQLGMRIDWASFEQAMGAAYHPTQGAPGISTRLMVALHYLKYQHDLSGENVVAHWVENPYWQQFSGERYFQHRLPIDASSMTRWRQRLGAVRSLQAYGQRRGLMDQSSGIGHFTLPDGALGLKDKQNFFDFGLARRKRDQATHFC